MDYESLVKLKGVRTTITYILLLLLTQWGLLADKLTGDNFVSIIQMTFGLYVTAKAAYKGVEMYQNKKNGTS